jgi:hypothetical protein
MDSPSVIKASAIIGHNSILIIPRTLEGEE